MPAVTRAPTIRATSAATAERAAMRAFLDRPRALAGLGLSKPSRATANAALSREPPCRPPPPLEATLEESVQGIGHIRHDAFRRWNIVPAIMQLRGR